MHMLDLISDKSYDFSTWLPEAVENDSVLNGSAPSLGNISDPQIVPADLSGWGPKRDPLYIVIPVTIIYAVIFFTGLIGNISTCIVISRNRAMHTATNYYLFSLAISDLLLLVSGLPPEIYFIWSHYPYIFGEAFCVLQSFAAETSANATVLTITAFTVERYVAICHPFLSHTMSKLSRAVKFVVAIWTFALCLAIPQAMAFGVVYQELGNGSISTEHCMCMVKRQIIPHSFQISTFVFFVSPMLLITILYILIGLQLHRSTVGPSRGNSVKMKHRIYKTSVNSSNAAAQAVLVLNGEAEKLQNNQEEEGRKNFNKNAQATKHVVKMLVAVVAAFFICWAPFHTQRLFAMYAGETADNVTVFKALTYISGVFYYLSTTVNPVLYHIMSHKFREAFKSTFRQCFRRGRRKPGGRCYSALSGRSSQVNSHSNTDSYSRQSSLRYLDAEMARLHDSRRPLVVSFRRKTPAASRRQGVNSDLQEVLDSLNNANQDGYIAQRNETDSDKKRDYVVIHSLRPYHVCPLNFKSKNIEVDGSAIPNGHFDAFGEVKSGNICKSVTLPEMRTRNGSEWRTSKQQNRKKPTASFADLQTKVATCPCSINVISSNNYRDNIIIEANSNIKAVVF